MPEFHEDMRLVCGSFLVSDLFHHGFCQVVRESSLKIKQRSILCGQNLPLFQPQGKICHVMSEMAQSATFFLSDGTKMAAFLLVKRTIRMFHH